MYGCRVDGESNDPCVEVENTVWYAFWIEIGSESHAENQFSEFMKEKLQEHSVRHEFEAPNTSQLTYSHLNILEH